MPAFLQVQPPSKKAVQLGEELLESMFPEGSEFGGFAGIDFAYDEIAAYQSVPKIAAFGLVVWIFLQWFLDQVTDGLCLFERLLLTIVALTILPLTASVTTSIFNLATWRRYTLAGAVQVSQEILAMGAKCYHATRMYVDSGCSVSIIQDKS